MLLRRAVFRFVNTYIRGDVDNRLRLRARLDADQETIITWIIDVYQFLFRLNIPPERVPSWVLQDKVIRVSKSEWIVELFLNIFC